MKITKGIYQCGIQPDTYLYFTGHIDNTWLNYIYITSNKRGNKGVHTACTFSSGRYKPENLLIPCKSYKAALELFTPEHFPELFI